MSKYDHRHFDMDGTQSPGPTPQPPNRSNSGGNDDLISALSWLIDIGLIVVAWPLGLFLTIANASGFNPVGKLLRLVLGRNRSSAQQAQYVQQQDRQTARTAGTYSVPGEQRTASSRTYGPAQPMYASQRTGAQTQNDLQAEQQRQRQARRAEKQEAPGVRSPDAGALLKTVVGWLMAAVGLIGSVAVGVGGSGLWAVLTWIAVALGGGALVLSTALSKRKAARFRSCLTVSGTKGIVDIKKLSKTLGLEESEASKLLSEMIDRGYYGTRAYIDHERHLLVIEPEQMRDVYKAEDEARTRAAAEQKRASQTEYETIIEKIRQADIDIDDEAMSEKIRRMQSITSAIFAEVELHPEKRPQIERFMNYYLPTTLKLLDSYARIEAQGVSGENMAKAKADIERIADTLVAGYEKQLDTLYQAEAVDIAGDVGVIESMMKRDGLTGGADFRPIVEPAAQEGGQVMGGH